MNVNKPILCPHYIQQLSELLNSYRDRKWPDVYFTTSLTCFLVYTTLFATPFHSMNVNLIKFLEIKLKKGNFLEIFLFLKRHYFARQTSVYAALISNLPIALKWLCMSRGDKGPLLRAHIKIKLFFNKKKTTFCDVHLIDGTCTFVSLKILINKQVNYAANIFHQYDLITVDETFCINSCTKSAHIRTDFG